MKKKFFVGMVAILVCSTLMGIYEWFVKKPSLFEEGIYILIGNSYYIILYIMLSAILLFLPNNNIQYIIQLAIICLIILMQTIHLLNLISTYLEINSQYRNEIENIKLIIDKLDMLFRLGIDMIEKIIQRFAKQE